MILYQNVQNMSSKDIIQCKVLIDANFSENRFEDYIKTITYKKNNAIIGFVGIYDNLLNQLCTDKEYRNQGIATRILNVAKQTMKTPIFLFIDKNKQNTQYLLKFYFSNGFYIDYENDVEYKMRYDIRFEFKQIVNRIFCFLYYYFLNIFEQIKQRIWDDIDANI
jgi:GNAT superfamily N-acetyltransferase